MPGFDSSALNPDGENLPPESQPADQGTGGDVQVQTSQPVQPEDDIFQGVVPEDLPPELDAVKKRMEARFFEKTRDLASQRKELEDMASLGRVVKNNPQIAAMLAGQVSGPAQMPRTTGAESMGEDLDAYIQKLEPDAVKGVNAILEKWAREKFEPRAMQVLSFVDGIRQEQLQQRWDSLKRQFPEAEKFGPQMLDYMSKNPSEQDLKRVFFAVAGESLFQQQSARQQDTARRQQAQLTRPSVPAQKVAPQANKKSLREIFSELMNKQA